MTGKLRFSPFLSLLSVFSLFSKLSISKLFTYEVESCTTGFIEVSVTLYVCIWLVFVNAIHVQCVNVLWVASHAILVAILMTQQGRLTAVYRASERPNRSSAFGYRVTASRACEYFPNTCGCGLCGRCERRPERY